MAAAKWYTSVSVALGIVAGTLDRGMRRYQAHSGRVRQVAGADFWGFPAIPWDHEQVRVRYGSRAEQLAPVMKVCGGHLAVFVVCVSWDCGGRGV